MTPITEIFARIIADVDRLHKHRSDEVELVRSGTRRSHRRLDLVNVGTRGFLTAHAAPTCRSNSRSALSLGKTFTVGKGNSMLLYLIYQYTASIDELRS